MSEFQAGQAVRIVGSTQKGHVGYIGMEGVLDEPSAVFPGSWDVHTNGVYRTFPATSLCLSLPFVFKRGDKVRVVAECVSKGQIGTYKGLDDPGYLNVEINGRPVAFAFPDSLELVSTLIPGTRVRTSQDSRPSWLRGKEGVVVELERGYNAALIAVDMADGREPSHYEADELEVLPERKREPKAGEVWEFTDVTGDAQATLITKKALVSLKYLNHTGADKQTFEWLANPISPWKFLAPDLPTYYAGLK